MSHRAAGSSAGTGGPVPQVTAKTDKGLPVPQVNRTGYIGGCQFRRFQMRTGYIGGLNRVTAPDQADPAVAASRFRGAGGKHEKLIC